MGRLFYAPVKRKARYSENVHRVRAAGAEAPSVVRRDAMPPEWTAPTSRRAGGGVVRCPPEASAEPLTLT